MERYRIETKTLVDGIEKAIYEYINKEALSPGDSLPSEIEMAGMMGVSRNAVREALSRMKALGMVESRKKRGIVLTAPDVTKSFDKIFCPQMLDQETLVDLLELRLWLERAIVSDLFERVTPGDIEELEKIISSEPGAMERRLTVSQELAFHSKIYSITGNKVIANLQDSLIPVYRHVYENWDEFAKVTGLHKHKSASHEDLLNSLKSADKADYRQNIDKHLKPYRIYVDNYRNKK